MLEIVLYALITVWTILTVISAILLFRSRKQLREAQLILDKSARVLAGQVLRNEVIQRRLEEMLGEDLE